VSVYTNIIIHFVGTEDELKNVISPEFDEYDIYLTKLFDDYYKFYHPECNTHDLMVTMEKIANHKKCKDIFSEVTWQYKG